MAEGGPPSSRIGPTQGWAGGPPSSKIAGGRAPPGGGAAPITTTTGPLEPSIRVMAPLGEEGEVPHGGWKVGEYSTETGEYRTVDGRVFHPGEPEAWEVSTARREEPSREGELSAETLADPGLG